MALLEDIVLYDTRANQPAATAVGVGTIYYVTDENVTERSNGATWDDMSDGGGGAGSDTTAIHDNVAGEIAAITQKVTPVSGDFLLIEDSAAANAKKYITIGSLPGGGGGTETRRIPIDLRNPRVSTLSGNSFFTTKALTNIDLGMWEFVKDVQGKVYGIVNVPGEVDATANAKIILIIAANATSGATRLNVSSKCVAEDAESINVTLTADTAQDITVPGTAYLGKKVSFTAGDLSNLAANDVIFVEILHEGDHVNDTLAVNTLLLDAYLEVDVTPA